MEQWEIEQQSKYFREKQVYLNKQSNNSFIGVRFGGITLDTLTVTDANRAAIEGIRSYAKDIYDNVSDGCSVGFLGPKGTGKTALLVALHRATLTAEINSLLISAVEFFAGLKRTFDTQEHSDLIRLVKTAQVLTIDDIGRGPVNPWRNELMMEILDARWREARPTHFSSNMESREQLTEFMQDEGIVDRLFCTTESEGCDLPMVAVYRMTGKSWR